MFVCGGNIGVNYSYIVMVLNCSNKNYNRRRALNQQIHLNMRRKVDAIIIIRSAKCG